jgi:hypothetical protein
MRRRRLCRPLRRLPRGPPRRPCQRRRGALRRVPLRGTVKFTEHRSSDGSPQGQGRVAARRGARRVSVRGRRARRRARLRRAVLAALRGADRLRACTAAVVGACAGETEIADGGTLDLDDRADSPEPEAPGGNVPAPGQRTLGGRTLRLEPSPPEGPRERKRRTNLSSCPSIEPRVAGSRSGWRRRRSRCPSGSSSSFRPRTVRPSRVPPRPSSRQRPRRPLPRHPCRRIQP